MEKQPGWKNGRMEGWKDGAGCWVLGTRCWVMVASTQYPDNQVDFDGEYEPGKKLKRIVTTHPDLLNQIINISFRMEWDENDETKHDVWNLPLRYYFRYELEHLIERSPFTNYTILGDYSGNALNAESKDFIVVCRK